jgi:hypothetical protein
VCLTKEIFLLQVYKTEPEKWTTQFQRVLQAENEKTEKHGDNEK